MSATVLRLPVRWHPTVTPEEVTCTEANGSYQERVWPLAADQTALVMVDCWDTHPVLSHLENSGRISREVIRPLIDACHRLGITVVHAPSPPQAQQYPQWLRYAGDAELGYAGQPATTGGGDRWPPAEFVSRNGEWADLQRPTYLRPVDHYLHDRRILPELAPHDDEFVVASGEQLHRLCRHRKLLHLLFCGFATNMCVLHRDYGIIALSQRGYNCVLLRDATIGIEAAHTYANQLQTNAAIVQVELLWGVSSLASHVIGA